MNSREEVEKGYLCLLVGALLLATRLLPAFDIFTPNFILFFGLSVFGYLLILMGIRAIQTPKKELESGYAFAFIAFILRFIHFLLLITSSSIMATDFFRIFIMLSFFFSVGTFFLLFKAEYMWSSDTTKRGNWFVYSAVALVKLVNYGVMMFPDISFRILPLDVVITIFEAFRFVLLLHYAVLIYILVRLYLEARRNAPSNEWHN